MRRPWIRRILWGIGLGPALGIGGFTAGALITDRLEQDNRFCIACHAPKLIRVGEITYSRLHEKIYREFQPADGRASNLAAGHNLKPQVKCIDCHIGAGSRDYLIIKGIAARDAAKYLVGRYREPEGLTYALGERTCLKCHPDGGQNLKNPKTFHNAPYHRDPRNACSDCHRSHDEAPAESGFLQQVLVKPRCDSCHLEILGIKPH